MKFIRLRKAVLVVIGLCFFLFVIIEFKNLKSGSEDNFVSFPKVTDTYFEILPIEQRKNFKPNLTFYSKHVNPIATFSEYKNDSKLVILKFNLRNPSTPLTSLLQMYKDVESVGNDQILDKSIKIPGYDLLSVTKLVSPLSKINLSIDGTEMKTIKVTDSLIEYQSRLNELSIKDSNDVQLIFLKNKLAFSSQLINILFLKKNQCIYFILKFPNRNKTIIPDSHLYELFVK